MHSRLTLKLGFVSSLLLFALPLQARSMDDMHGEEDACAACELADSDVASLLDSYMLGSVPETFCDSTPEVRVAQAKESPAAYYAEVVTSSGDATYFIEAMVERYQAKSTNRKGRAHILDLALYLGAQVTPKSVAMLWESDSRSFSVEHMVALAKNAPKKLTEAIEKAAKKEVLPAAYLALRGDDRGAKVLRRAVKRMNIKKGASDAALAAFALSYIGDDSAMSQVRDGFEEAALSALDMGDFESARNLVLEAQFLCKELVRGGKRASLGRLDQRARWYAQGRAEEVANAEAVFALIEGLRG